TAAPDGCAPPQQQPFGAALYFTRMMSLRDDWRPNRWLKQLAARSLRQRRPGKPGLHRGRWRLFAGRAVELGLLGHGGEESGARGPRAAGWVRLCPLHGLHAPGGVSDQFAVTVHPFASRRTFGNAQVALRACFSAGNNPRRSAKMAGCNSQMYPDSLSPTVTK